MKKKSKIRVLKYNQERDDSYTFVMDLKQSIDHNLKAQQTSKETEENNTAATGDDLNKIYKKKKVLTNEDLRKTSKGLKFNNPSQRNHSSIYE
jgi:hypothetical protein